MFCLVTWCVGEMIVVLSGDLVCGIDDWCVWERQLFCLGTWCVWDR